MARDTGSHGQRLMADAERLVIVNPASGGGRTAERWRAIVQSLRAHHVPVRVEVTTASGHATDLAHNFVRGGGREIVAIGGDGTVGETTAGLVDVDGKLITPDVTLSIIHQGTGGDLARALDIPRRAHEAVDIAANGHPRRIDLGVAAFKVAGSAGQARRAFANCANVGLGADVVSEVTTQLKRLSRSSAFGIAAARCILRNQPRRMTLTRGGVSDTLDLVELMVGNSHYMGGGMLATPKAQVDDGQLDVVMVQSTSRPRLLVKLPKIYRGTHLDDPITRWFRDTSFSIDSREPQGVALDGELVGTTPVSFDVIPSALAIRVPG